MLVSKDKTFQDKIRAVPPVSADLGIGFDLPNQLSEMDGGSQTRAALWYCGVMMF